MDKSIGSTENAVVCLQIITKLVQDFERKVSLKSVRLKEFEELKILKEKCCDQNETMSCTAFHGFIALLKKRILAKSQTVSMFVSLLPGIAHYGALVSAIGDILLLDLHDQIQEKDTYHCNFSMGELKHPFVMVLNHNKEKSWFHIYLFIIKLMENKSYSVKYKIKLLRPVFHHIFWNISFKGSQFQIQLFNTLLKYVHQTEILNFILEVLTWQDTSIHYCFYLRDFFIYLLELKCSEKDLIVSGITPLLAVATKWLIINGHDPSLWISLIFHSLEIDDAASSVVLYLLTDVILNTSSKFVNLLIDLCKFIIFNFSPNRYVAYQFIAVVLNWFISPSSLVNPLYDSVNEIILFLNKNIKWSDNTFKLVTNKYFKIFASTEKDIKFAVDLIIVSDLWKEDKKLLFNWLKNLQESNHLEIQFKLHSFLFGIILSENDYNCINLSLNLLLNLINSYRDISFSVLCLIFYKLGKEIDPKMQKTYIFCLPKLAFKKENIPLIVGIIESLKKNHTKIMMPLVIQLYLLLWKLDNRTYSYLHKILHDTTNSEDFHWELNVSRAIVLREICSLAPHSHGKDLVGVLSKILNECANHKSGFASAIAIEAVTELCKSFVIDVAGTWNAIQPKLCLDKRPQVIISLCKFFGEIPNLNSPEDKYNQLMNDVIPMLWNYSFNSNVEITKHSFRALSNYQLENMPLKLLPEIYKSDIKFSKISEKGSKPMESVVSLPYVPGECWTKFLEKIDEKVVGAGTDLIIVIIERELKSLPRPTFFLPPEKPEPLTYSYLPQDNTCRALVECLQKHVEKHSENPPRFLKAVIRVLSHEYSKLLPPLNWTFLEYFLNFDTDFKYLCLFLMAKQGLSSKSARSVLENYMKSVEWNNNKLEEILQLYKKLASVCKSISYNALQHFLKSTLTLSLKLALEKNTGHFEKILTSISLVLRKSSVQSGHKALITKELEKVMMMIPPDLEVMESFALCAIEFPIQAIERITNQKPSTENYNDVFRQTVIIRRAIAMRADIKAPLVWLNECIEAAAEFPSEQNFVLETIWRVIRHRRDCNHMPWMKELLWKIQGAVTNYQTFKSSSEILFLIDVFMTSTIILSGYDCFFEKSTQYTLDLLQVFQVFPQSLRALLCVSEWVDLLPKVVVWLYKSTKWKDLPSNYTRIIIQSLLTFKEAQNFLDENSITKIFDEYFSSQ